MSISPVDAVGPASSQIKNANNIKRAEALSNDKLSPLPQSDLSSDSVEKAGASSTASAPYAVSKISTEGFVGLRTEKEGDFDILDRVIEKIHKNLEELGESLETLGKLIEKTDKQVLGMQILEQTFEAIDQMRGEVSKK